MTESVAVRAETPAFGHAQLPREEFFRKVRDRNTAPDGKEIQPNLFRRMSHPTCLACHETYRHKFPGKPFGIRCNGIYGEDDFAEMAEKSGVPYDEIRELLDLPFWASRHVRLPDINGDLAPFEARDYQAESMQCTARFQVDRWGRGMGKALSLDSEIPTPAGWRRFGDLQPGDWVFDAEGLPTRVAFVSDVMYNHLCYEVLFSDGTRITADAEHLWETWTHAARKAESRKERRTGKLAHTRRVPRPSVVTTRQLRYSLLHGTTVNRVEHNHSVLVCGPLEYAVQDLPVRPYTLGAWLGDGTSCCNQIASDDIQILEAIENDGYPVKKLSGEFMHSVDSRQRQTNSLGQFISNGGLCSKLKELGVLDNKHIPNIYLQSSIEQRLELLKGLMDTDGCIGKNGACSFDNMNPALAAGVAELAVSLGLKITRNTKRAMLYEKDCGTCYRVQFTPHFEVFKLERKRIRQKAKVRSTQFHRYIVDVRQRPSVPVRCIEVDNPRHLFLIGRSCVPTHNTVDGVIKEVHVATTRKRYNILVACPAKAQAQKWFDEINALIEADPGLRDSLVQTRQQPYFTFRFTTGSTINLFTTGSSSGRDADVIRSQSPRRVRVDEQDLLNAGDYNAILPLLRRYPDSEFHGSSTPTGKRETFYSMCQEFPDYRELHFPIMRHPDFNEEMELASRREARTELNYMHEFLAEFGELEGGVFKAMYVDAAKMPYTYLQCRYDPAWKYYVGVDWNGEGTGTRLRVVGYNPLTRKRRVVDASAINISTMDTLDQLRILNRRWHAEGVYVDAGFGYVQDELIRLIGATSKNADDRRLMDVHVVDFGANMVTNRLVPNRPDSRYKDNEELERPTKPFMVEGVQMVVEMGDFEFASDDKILEDELRAYRVKTYSRHGWANTYHSKVGDHDLDATILALLGIELKYGLTKLPERAPSKTTVLYAAGFGAGPAREGEDPIRSAPSPQNPRQAAQRKGDVPSRQMPQVVYRDPLKPAAVAPDIYGNVRSFIADPGALRPGSRGASAMRNAGRSAVPSRTAMFRGAAKKGPYASSANRMRF